MDARMEIELIKCYISICRTELGCRKCLQKSLQMSSTARKRVGKTLTALIDQRIANGVLGVFGSQWRIPWNCSTNPRKFGDSAKPRSNPMPMFLKMSLSTHGNYGMVDLECSSNFWCVYFVMITG